MAKWLLEQDVSLLDARDSQRWSVLHMAAAFGSREAVKLFASLGVGLEDADAQGRTPLMLACAAGAVSVVQLLLKEGASTSALDALGLCFSPSAPLVSIRTPQGGRRRTMRRRAPMQR